MIRLGVVSDMHLAPAGAASTEDAPGRFHNSYDFNGASKRLRDAVESFGRHRVDAIVALGDVTHLADEPSRREADAILAGAAAPVWVIAGNHDPVTGIDEPGCRLAPGIRLETLSITLTREDEWHSTTPPPTERWAEDLVVLASHFPVISRSDVITKRDLPYAGDLADRVALLQTISERNAPTVVINGHLHVRDSVSIGPVLQLSFAALVEYPFEHSIVEIICQPRGLPAVKRIALPASDTSPRHNPVFVPATEMWTYQHGGWHVEFAPDPAGSRAEAVA